MSFKALLWLCIIYWFVFFLTGCVSVGITPDLPFPPAPSVSFTLDGNPICLSEEAANDLAQYFEELHAYRQAVHRLHRAP